MDQDVEDGESERSQKYLELQRREEAMDRFVNDFQTLQASTSHQKAMLSFYHLTHVFFSLPLLYMFPICYSSYVLKSFSAT